MNSGATTSVRRSLGTGKARTGSPYWSTFNESIRFKSKSNLIE
jgi:hypothetical protein